MKYTRLTKQKGVFSAEFLFAVAGFMIFAAIMLKVLKPASTVQNVAIMVTDLSHLTSTAISLASNDPEGFNNTSIEDMVELSAIDESYGDGTAKNPYGGNYILAVGSNPFLLNVSSTGLPEKACKQLAHKLKSNGAVCNDTIVSFTITM